MCPSTRKTRTPRTLGTEPRYTHPSVKLTNILVPLAGTAIDPDLIEYAIALGRSHKAKITAVHVIEVKWNMPLDAVLDAELERGEEILALGEKVAEQLGAHLETEVLRAREAAAASAPAARSSAIRAAMPVPWWTGTAPGSNASPPTSRAIRCLVTAGTWTSFAPRASSRPTRSSP